MSVRRHINVSPVIFGYGYKQSNNHVNFLCPRGCDWHKREPIDDAAVWKNVELQKAKLYSGL